MARIQDIEQEMLRVQRRFESGTTADQPKQIAVKHATRTRSRRQVGRGELKEKIISALRAAGQHGLSVSDLSKKLRVKKANLYVWFNGTGRNVRAIKKIGPAKYKITR